MADTTTPPAAPPAAEPPPVTPTPEPPVESTRAMAENLVAMLTRQPEAETPPKPKAEPAPAPKAEPTPPKPEKQIKVKKAAAPPPEAPPPVPKREEPASAPVAGNPVDDEAAFEAALIEEEKALLDDARDAEKLPGGKYKDQASKTKAFLKENAAKAKEVDAGKLDQAEYQEWYDAHRPKISPLDLRAVERARVKADVQKEFEPRIAEERHARWVEAEAPKIEAKGAEIKRQLWSESLPKEVTDAANERLQGVTDETERKKIIAEVQQDYALELEVAEAVTTAARDDIQEFHRLMAINPATRLPLKKRNLDMNTPEGQQHARLAQMAHSLCDEFKTTGGAELKRDGKWFATWREWAAMSPEQQAGWWTFNNDELISRAQKKVPAAVDAAVKQRREYLEGRGFKRVIPTRTKQPPAPPAAPHAGSPPAPRVAPPPSGAAPGMSAAEKLVAMVGGTSA